MNYGRRETLYLYRDRPIKDKFIWYSPGFSLVLASASFPEVQWSDDEPTKLKITIGNSMEKIKIIRQNALTQIWKLTKIFAKCVFALWLFLLAIIYFVLCWVFVAITAIIDILTDGFNLEVTKDCAGEMQTLEDFIEDIKCFLKHLPEFIKS